MDLMTLLLAALTNPQLTYLVALIVAVLVLGVAASLNKGEFKLGNIADVVERQLLPVLLAYIVVAILAVVDPQWAVLRDGVFALLVARQIAAITQSLAALGLPIPPVLSQYFATTTQLKVLIDPKQPTGTAAATVGQGMPALKGVTWQSPPPPLPPA